MQTQQKAIAPMARKSLASIHKNPILTFEPSQQANTPAGGRVSPRQHWAREYELLAPWVSLSLAPTPFQCLFNPNTPPSSSSPVSSVSSRKETGLVFTWKLCTEEAWPGRKWFIKFYTMINSNTLYVNYLYTLQSPLVLVAYVFVPTSLYPVSLHFQRWSWW